MIDTRSNQQWQHDLNAGGDVQASAIADLRNIILRAALYSFQRNLTDFQSLSREEILQQAEDCAQDALIAVMDHLAEFRGDSKFTTWAYKFAINMALMTARRERWKGVSLDELTDNREDAFDEKEFWDGSGTNTLERSAMQQDLNRVIRQVIQEDLTEKQRQVLVLMVFNEVPMDEVVRHLGSNRNSVYKLLHDARRKLKNGLLAHGFGMEETIASFEMDR